MTDPQDGRGQLLPVPLWLRAIRWLTQHPMVGLVIALLGGLGVAGARARYYRTKAGRAQKAADVATVKAGRADTVVREAQAREAVKEADTAATDAHGAGESADPTLEEIADRWPKKPEEPENVAYRPQDQPGKRWPPKR